MVPLHKHRGGQAIPPPFSMEEANADQQQPMGPVGPALPPDAAPADPPSAPGGGGGGGGQGPVILSDVMGRDRSINIFAGFIRDIETAARRLDDSAQNSTVLAPLNSAIEALPRKPWEDPRDYGRLGADAYEGEDGQERAQRNLRRFVEAHIVPKSPWDAGERVRALDAGGGEVWWEDKDGVKVVQPGNIEVVNVASTVANGQVWILKGVRNYA
ncbi:putative fas1 domain-containing protein [Phaeoacremonium minimum UCRPA7]|uniref:Putative fas1 domain-containing protein n=1 Tax=Phaeoacremonium minimum (strain UCR-PA7) TaxID=1286976 RepID=R8BMR8_PHAM7|nr:putative fas1 domain-containing protein [Phaeoacremonium minimum UCRPA7]EOO00693.1 putative fas1 domain-containing protein [Phaeoacremonium minimum UCRPA7]